MFNALIASLASTVHLPTATVATALLLFAKATVVLLFAWLVTAIMQRMSAVSRHTVWFVSLLAVLAVPAVALLSPWQLHILPATIATGVSPTTVNQSTATPSVVFTPSADASVGGSSGAGKANIELTAGTPAVGGPTTWFSDLSVAQWLLLAWAVVAFALTSWLLIGVAVLARITRRATPVHDERWTTSVYEIADRLDLSDAPRLLRSTDILMPFACGLRTPTIVLPASSAEWSEPQRAAVLLHEMAHIKRRDIVGHTLGRLVCALYWFHPMVWSAAKRLRAESERACDDLALLSGARASEYAEYLLDIVSSVRRNTTPSPAMAMATRSEFEGRMLAILDATLTRRAPSRRQMLSLVTSAAALACVIGAASPAVSQPSRAGSSRAPISTLTSELAAPAPLDPVTHQDRVAPPAAPQSPIGRPITRAPVARAQDSIEKAITREVDELVRRSDNIGTSFGAAMLSLANLGIKAAADEIARDQVATHATPQDNAERVALMLNVLRTEQRADIRRVAVWGLAEYAYQRAVADVLASTLRKDVDGGVREMAAWSLAYSSPSQPSVSALIASARDDADDRVRHTAIWALTEANALESPAMISVLNHALSSPTVRVREVAAWAFGTLAPVKASAALVGALSDDNASVRESAAWALHEIADASTAGALSDALRKETTASVQLAEMRALAVLGEPGVASISRLIDSKDDRVRSMAVRLLASGTMDDPWPRPRPQPRPTP